MASKEVRKLITSLESQGWRIERLKSGHFRAYAPDGVGIVHLPGTPSDHRSLKNTVAQLRHHGYKD